MTKKLLNHMICSVLLFPFLAQADVTKDDFLVKTTSNLLNLCSASKQDPNYKEAIHFCHGYLVGAFHFDVAQSANKPELKLACFTEPYPSRNESIDMFVAWAKNHPEYMNDLPVETEFRFLTEKWPCKH